MSFVHPLFLFLLPLALIPLLLSLIARLNRKKQQFPSLELLQDIISRDRTARKLLIRLKQVVRALVIVFAVLAFAQPFFGGGARLAGPGKNTVAVIDPTLSMSRFDLARLARYLNEEWSVAKIYFGGELIRQEGGERYAIDPVQAEAAVREVLLKEGSNPPENLVLVSDGQECNFETPLSISSGIRSFHFIKPVSRKENRNLSVRSVSTFPGVVFPGENTEFLAEIAGPVTPNDRVRIFVNDREIYSERAGEKIAFSRILEGRNIRPGLNTGMVLLEGDDQTNDNRFYFPVISLPRPAVYSDIDSPVIHKIFSSIFPEFTVADIPEAASVVFSGRSLNVGGNKPVFLFCEDIKTTENILRKEFREFAEFNGQTADGNLVSESPALSLITGVKIRTRYRMTSADHVAASAGNVPLAYRYGNKTLFTFSVKENGDYFSDSPSLLLMVNEFLMDFYRGNFLIADGDPELKNKKLYDPDGLAVPVSVTPGVLKEKESGKTLFHNTGAESEAGFLGENDLRKKITGISQNRVSFREWDADRTAPVYPGFLAGIILIALAACLAFLEVL